MFKQGDIVRVKAPGKFYGQEVKVLHAHIRKGRTRLSTFQLDVKWDGISRPSYFNELEIELVER